MTDLTPDKLDEIEKAAKMGWDAFRLEQHATTLALVARVRELEAQVDRVREVTRDLERGSEELKSNRRYSESGICEAHARKLRKAIGEEA